MPKKTLEDIVGSQNHTILQVKDNQPTLHKVCQKICQSYNPIDKTYTRDLGHGRFDKRYCYVFSNPSLLNRYLTGCWKEHIKCIVLVHRERRVRDTRTEKWILSIEDSYYVSTRLGIAKDLLEIIRGHWGIENKNNHVRDESMGEDYSRIRVKPDIMVRFRSFALNIMRANGEKNIKNALYENALDTNRVINYRFLLC